MIDRLQKHIVRDDKLLCYRSIPGASALIKIISIVQQRNQVPGVD